MSLINSKSKKDNQDKVISLGLATLNSEFKKFFPQEIKRRYEKKFSQKYWSLKKKNYFKTNWSIWFSYMRVTKVELIAFKSANLCSKFLRDISHIQMQNLKKIDLSGNRITSIENLTYLFAPNLEIIHLQGNKIMNATKTLTKFDFKKLSQINIGDNLVQEINVGRVISQTQKGFMISNLIIFNDRDSKYIINDLSAFAKIKNLNFQSFRHFSCYYQPYPISFLDEIGFKITIFQKKCRNALLRKQKEQRQEVIFYF